MKKATTAIMMALLAGTMNIYAVAEHDFSSGTTIGGTGWSTYWALGSSGTPTYVNVNSSYYPLDGNGKYSSMWGLGHSSTAGMHRDYTAGIDPLTDEHTISFLVRIDTLDSATGDFSRAIVSHGGITYELAPDTSWALYVQDGTFHYFNGDGTGSLDGAATDSGVNAIAGTIYFVKVTNRIGADTTGPTTGGEYDLLVTADGSPVLSLTNLEYLRTTAPEAGFIGLGVSGSNKTSYDQVYIGEIDPITVEKIPAGLVLTWDSVSGMDYEVQSKVDLTSSWNTYTNVVATDSTMAVTTAVDHVEAFFRVISEL